MSSSEQSVYVGKDSSDVKFSSKRRSPFIVGVSSFFAVLIVVMTLVPAVASLGIANNNNGTVKAEASGFGLFCNDLGANMKPGARWRVPFKNYALEDKSSRTFTLEEAFGNATNFVHYNGEGEGADFIVGDKSTPPPEWVKTDLAKLEALRTVGNCTTSRVLTEFSNWLIAMSSGISTISSFIISKAFDPNLICSDVNNTSDGCLNLLQIIGGSGESGEGIIGILTSSIYYPLLVMAVAVTGLWVLYKGIVQRKIREAMFGAIWVVLSVIFGLIMLLNPSLMAKAPMVISNSVATCIIGAFNGQNCFTDTDTGADTIETGSVNICESDVIGASLPEKMSLTTNSITCTIWKAFLLNPISEASFGSSFDDLDTKENPLKGTLESAGLDPDDYCVNLRSSASAKDMFGKTLTLDGSQTKICNLMAYQMFLQVDARSGSLNDFDENTAAPGEIDERWYKIVDAAATDNGMWQQWSPSGTSAMNKVSISVLSLVTTVLGSFILVVTALFALVYFLSGILLMAFAPIFLLIGVHPGRGKSIMLGWVEKVASNILKYIASAAFLVVAIAIYAGILGNIENMALTLLFVIIVSMALFMYRSELVNLSGRVNMGGEQMSSAMTDKLRSVSSGAATKSRNMATAAAGGAIGATLASGKNPFDLRNTGSNFKTAFSGASDGTKRELRRGSGMVSNVARQAERNSVANRQELTKTAQSAEAASNMTAQNVIDDTLEFDSANAELDSFRNTKKPELERELPNLEAASNTRNTAENRVLSDIKREAMRSYADNDAKIAANDPVTGLDPQALAQFDADNKQHLGDVQLFGEIKELQNSLRDMDVEIRYSVAIGDTATESDLRNRKNVATQEIANKHNLIDPQRFNQLDQTYNSVLAQEKSNLGIDTFDSQEDDFIKLRVDEHEFSKEQDRLIASAASAAAQLDRSTKAHKEAEVTSSVYRKKVDDLSVGQTVTRRTIIRTENKAQAKAAEQTPAIVAPTVDTTRQVVAPIPLAPIDQSVIPDRIRPTGLPTSPQMPPK